MNVQIIKFTSYLLLGAMLGCSSAPPSKTLPQSEVAVSSIDHSNYRNFLNDDVDAAQSKLEQAKDAATNKNHLIAEYLAQQILVDVELIKLKTQRLQTEQEVKYLETEIENLHKEIQWREPVQLSPLEQ